MSWLNLNQSLSSLKGQITNFASEVLSETPGEDTGGDEASNSRQDSSVKELEEKCFSQEQEITTLKKQVEELQASLQIENLSKRNGVRDEDPGWYWDPPAEPSRHSRSSNIEEEYKQQIQALQNEISHLKPSDSKNDDIVALREENRNLKANLDELDHQHQLEIEKLFALKKELQSNFEILKQDYEGLKGSKEDYSNELKSLLQKIGDRDKEIETLKTTKTDHDTLFHKYQNLERIHSILRENAEKFQEENQELHEEVFKLQEHKAKLEHDIEVLQKQSEQSDVVPKDTYEALVKEITELRDRQSKPIHLNEVNFDDNAKTVIESLKRNIKDLESKLNANETCKPNKDDSNSNVIKPERVMQLYNRYINFELPIDYVGEIPTLGENVVYTKLENVFKTVHSFKKDIDVYEQKLSEKSLSADHLQTQIDDLTTENDFLSTDIQHVERELNEMKKNNDFLISEIAALKNTSKLQPIIETHEDNLAKLETELADCNRLNKDFESEIKKIEKQLAEVSDEKKLFQESLHDLKHKYSTVLDEFEMFKKQTYAVEHLESVTKDKEHERLQKKSTEVEDLRGRLSKCSSENEQLSIDIHILKNDKVLLTKEVDDFKKSLLVLEKDKQILTKESNDLKHALNEKTTAHKDLDNLKVSLDKKLQDFEGKLDEVIRHKAEIETEKENLTLKVTKLETQLSSSQINIDSVTTERDTLNQQIEHLSKRNTSLFENIQTFESEISQLQHKIIDLEKKNNVLESSLTVDSKCNEAKDTLKAKLIEQETLIFELQSKNGHLLERNNKVEEELASTDEKIVHLEQEFDRFVSDINEKDTIIKNLNITIEEKNTILKTLHQEKSDLLHKLEKKTDDLENLKFSCDEARYTYEDMNKLQIEKEEISAKLYILGDEISIKDNEISNLTLQVEQLQKSSENYKTDVEDKDKQIKELQQSIVEITDKLKIMENVTAIHLNEEYKKLLTEKQSLESQVSELKDTYILNQRTLEELRENYEQAETTIKELKTLVETANSEKKELINLVTLKHNESIQYHNEIQRLSHVIVQRNEKYAHLIEEKDNLIQNPSDKCSHCEAMRMSLKEKDEIIIGLNKTCSECDVMKVELEKAKQTVKQLSERCEYLDKNLEGQIEIVKRLTTENAQLSEHDQNSTRELERLRHHLMETEENYTQELMASEQKLSECVARLQQVEDRAKQTSTVYTSNSIRANQEVETLRNQIKLLEKQRDDVQSRLSDAEDARNRSEAALTNLQVVLEQFQLEKERDIHTATEKLRNKMDTLNEINTSLKDEILRINKKLEEALAGLQAAHRLGDQVESKTAQINDLKEQVRTLHTSVTAAEERYYNAISNQQDKVDKNLIKNLVINYALTAANSSNKTQVLRLLSTVLDFNQQECEKLGLSRSTTTQDSLAAEFVKFLQQESRPRASLPSMMNLTQGSRSSTPTSRKNSTIGPPPPIQATHSRNPSTGSNNLLFQNIDKVDTMSQLSRDSDKDLRVLSPSLDTGVNQTRNTEGAILKSVLKDM